MQYNIKENRQRLHKIRQTMFSKETLENVYWRAGTVVHGDMTFD